MTVVFFPNERAIKFRTYNHQIVYFNELNMKWEASVYNQYMNSIDLLEFEE